MDTCQLVLKWDFKYSYPKIRSKLQSYCRVSSKLVAPGENTHIPQKIVISDVSSPPQHPATGSSCTLRWESPGTNHPVATLPWFRLFFCGISPQQPIVDGYNLHPDWPDRWSPHSRSIHQCRLGPLIRTAYLLIKCGLLEQRWYFQLETSILFEHFPASHVYQWVSFIIAYIYVYIYVSHYIPLKFQKPPNN